MKVHDLFPFNNELDLLELRMAELSPVVDRFCAVELPVTFTGLPKPLYLTESGRTGVEILTPGAYPEGPHPTVDWFQRASLGKFVKEAADDDWILLGDVDEIPSRTAVETVIGMDLDYPVVLRMKLYYHRVDLLDPGPWLGTVICKRRCLGEDPNMQQLRDDRTTFPVIERGGWHFSWMGNASAIGRKLLDVDIERESAIYGSGGILVPPRDEAFLASCYENGADLFRRGRDKKHIPIIPGDWHPHEILPWLEKHPQYVKMQ